MADLSYIQATQETKIVGQDATGNNVNYVSADANGNMLVKDYSDGPVTPGTVAAQSSLGGAQFNTAAPTLTNGQQAALQADSAGNLKVRDLSDGSVAAGTAATVSSLAGGVFNGTLPALTNGQQAALQLDADGRLLVASVPLDGDKATYVATGTVTPAAAATAIFALTGSATKTVKVTQVTIAGVQTTAGTVNFSFFKYSTALTGGTSVAGNLTPLDSTDGAPTATTAFYSANFTGGGASGGTTGNGTIRVVPVYLAPLVSLVDRPETIVTYGDRPGQAVVLRGTAQVFAINLTGVTVVGGSILISVEWTEA